MDDVWIEGMEACVLRMHDKKEMGSCCGTSDDVQALGATVNAQAGLEPGPVG
ncbi:MAG TPA: hypothetical protein VLI71_18590 [Gammaproteobacteria bacterium]|nr:hypothetical protein [Gammaproteobacteria bacterium]